jgi:hypothetical protein
VYQICFETSILEKGDRVMQFWQVEDDILEGRIPKKRKKEN